MLLPFFLFFRMPIELVGISKNKTRLQKMINTIKKLNNALTKISKENTASVLLEAEQFAVQQLVEHKNASPIAAIATALSNIAGKPFGLSPKEYVAHYEAFGLEWNAKAKVFKFGKGADVTGAVAGYWLGMEKPESEKLTPVQKAEKAIGNIVKSKVTYEQALAVLNAAYNAQSVEAA